MNLERVYWNRRYMTGQTSGYGSYGIQLQRKLNWLRPYQFKSIIELGCGDFHFGSHLLAIHPECKSYTGLDVSDFIIEQNQKEFPEHTFATYNGGTLSSADLILCIDVLFHVLSDDNCEQVLKTLEQSDSRYLALTAYERSDRAVSPHVKIRKLNYQRFGEPLVREIVEEDGCLYFYLFRR